MTGKELAAMRAKAGLTQEALARKMKLMSGGVLISRWETGLTAISGAMAELAERVCEETVKEAQTT